MGDFNCLSDRLLGRWVKAAKQGKLDEIGKSQRPLTEVEVELVNPILGYTPNSY